MTTMTMITRLRTAVFLWVLGELAAGRESRAQTKFILQGSDTLEAVTEAVIDSCGSEGGGVSLSSVTRYVGGGSGFGEAAMLPPRAQHVAPMSRELAGAACAPGASELLIGLDGISILTANQTGGDSLNPIGANVCTDSIWFGNRSVTVGFGGCSSAEISSGACDNQGRYVFGSWRDYLALIYGGQNHGTAPQLNPDGSRNPARVNCASAIRRTLVDDWASIFSDGSTGTGSCRTGTCRRLKHAFRLGDLAGTTDDFVSLVGLVPIPPFTTTAAGNVPTRDGNATANPFCNAGDRVMNKGDSDYLDMDPIRRIADSAAGLQNRQGKEQVAQGYWSPSNPPPVGGGDSREIEDPAAAPTALKPLVPLPDFSHPAAQNWSFDPNTTGALGLQRDSFAKFTSATTGNARQGLGLVLPIVIPGNYTTVDIAYWSFGAGLLTPVPCTPGKFAPSILCPTCVNVLCPDGGQTTCTLPVDTTALGTLASPNYNCLSDRATPTPPPGSLPLKDPRVYNLLVVDQTGKAVKDNYRNPNLSLSTVRQNRLVSAFYRLHTSEVTNFGGQPTIAGNPNPGTPSTNLAGVCEYLPVRFGATAQIGCLVRASPCSIGYTDRGANDNMHTVAAQIQGLQPDFQSIRNFAKGASPSYPLARGLYVNSTIGFSNVLDVGAPGDDVQIYERSLLGCFGAFSDPKVPGPIDRWISNAGLVSLDRNDVPLPGLSDCAVAP